MRAYAQPHEYGIRVESWDYNIAGFNQLRLPQKKIFSTPENPRGKSLSDRGMMTGKSRASEVHRALVEDEYAVVSIKEAVRVLRSDPDGFRPFPLHPPLNTLFSDTGFFLFGYEYRREKFRREEGSLLRVLIETDQLWKTGLEARRVCLVACGNGSIELRTTPREPA